MLGLCLADFIYLFDLIFVAATSLNGKSWPFGSVMCSVYHGTETTGILVNNSNKLIISQICVSLVYYASGS